MTEYWTTKKSCAYMAQEIASAAALANAITTGNFRWVCDNGREWGGARYVAPDKASAPRGLSHHNGAPVGASEVVFTLAEGNLYRCLGRDILDRIREAGWAVPERQPDSGWQVITY